MLRLPYSLALLCLQKLLAIRVPGTKLWARNSYLTSAFKPLKSDLDLTLLLLTAPNLEQRLKIKSLLSRAKRVFPALGETNWYVAEELNFLAGLVNPFELERDPKLLALYPKLSAPSSSATKLVWLLRLIEADLENLTKNSRARKNKWALHFAAAGLSWPLELEFSLENLTATILQQSFPTIDHKLVLKYLMARHKNTPLHLVAQEPWFDMQLVAIFPHRFCFLDKSSIKEKLTNSPAMVIALEQLAWECFGLYTQFRHLGATAVFEEHLRNITDLLNALPKAGDRHLVVKQAFACLRQIFTTETDSRAG